MHEIHMANFFLENIMKVIRVPQKRLNKPHVPVNILKLALSVQKVKNSVVALGYSIPIENNMLYACPSVLHTRYSLFVVCVHLKKQLTAYGSIICLIKISIMETIDSTSDAWVYIVVVLTGTEVKQCRASSISIRHIYYTISSCLVVQGEGFI